MDNQLFKSNNSDKHDVSINISKFVKKYEEFNVNNLLDVLFIQQLYYFDINNEIKNFLDKIINRYNKEILNYSFSKDELIHIVNELNYLSENIKYDRVSKIFNILFENLKKIDFNDCLLNELLNLSYVIENKPIVYTIRNISKLINLDNKSSKFLNEIDNINITNNQSKELYHSVITQTNWIEELNDGNFMGLLINIVPNKLNKNGYNVDYIPISEITHTIIGFDQIIEIYKNNTNNNFSNLISGYGIGNGNCIIPVYINEYHWKFANLYFDYNLGMIFNRNPLDYHYKQTNIYIHVLFKMINYTFSDENYSSDKWINILFSILRTNYEIYQNNNNLCKFINDAEFRVSCNLQEIGLEYLFSSRDDCIHLIFEELVRRTLKNIYKDIKVLDKIYDFDIDSALNYNIEFEDIDSLINNNKFEEWVINLQNNKIFSDKITLIYGLIMMKNIISKDNFFESFDRNGGILDSNVFAYVKDFIESTKIKPVNYELFGLINPKFSSHINFTKSKVFSVNTFIELNLVKDNNQLKDILIQSLFQRVNKNRINAIKNNKLQNPFLNNNILKQIGLLISQRYIKKIYNLSDYLSYINVINTIELTKLGRFLYCMVDKTISIKKDIMNNFDLIEESRKIYFNNNVKKIDI